MDARTEAALAFCLPEGELTLTPFGNGHINRTFALSIQGQEGRWILQQINSYVFPRPEQVQENIMTVTSYLRDVIAREGGDPERETMRVIPAKDGKTWYRDFEGNWWRVFPLVSGTVSRDLPDTPELFRECGRTFGCFQRRLTNFPAGELHETITRFHDTPNRVRQLEDAVVRNAAGRLKEVEPQLAFCRARYGRTGELVKALERGELPLRVTHNDTKLNNVLLDEATGTGVCVVDLDTVMPGLAAYDFGEGIRTGACTAAEDEQDLSRVSLSMPMYRAFAEGYLSEMGSVMSPAEIRSLPMGAWMMTMENGLRFLADYLNGDVYFHVSREKHNLDRAKVQFRLLECMEENWEEMMAALS